MGIEDSPHLVASRLESQIILSESKSHTLIFEAESRLSKRIHELEMKLIRKGAFCDPDSAFQWVCLAFVIFLITTMILMSINHHDRDDAKPTPQASQAEAPAPQGASSGDEPR